MAAPGTAKIARLTDRALVGVTGEDAEKFLQAIVTCDIDRLQEGEASFGALLSPQGKILFDFFVIRSQDGFLLDVARTMREEFTRRLNFYRLRAKVGIEAEDSIRIFATWNSEAPPASGDFAIPDPRLPRLGARYYGATPPEGEEGDYDAHRLALGMPEGGKDYAFGDSFPHEALMDQFGGVDFAKGCYIGQEVVSRMQHRGTARKRVVMVEGGAILPPAGTPVEAGGRPVGAMGSSNGRHGLAMLRLDRVQEALDAGEAVTAGGQTITVRLQDWVKFGWPERRP